MQPERRSKLDSLGRYMQEQSADYDRLEEEKQRLFREAAERVNQARQAESRPSFGEQVPGPTGELEVFGRYIVIQPADYFQDKLDLESGQAKTVYIWVMTASGWAYGGPLTVFQSETQAELEDLVTARFGGGPDQHIIVEAPDYAEASRLFGLLSRFQV